MLSAVTFYDESVHKLVPKNDMCLNVKYEYVEKWTKVCAKTCSLYSVSVLLLKNTLVW